MKYGNEPVIINQAATCNKTRQRLIKVRTKVKGGSRRSVASEHGDIESTPHLLVLSRTQSFIEKIQDSLLNFSYCREISGY